ncbi:ShlB/FhaC/HecB family hemolysin secretion/activation protein [Uliginosibacterium gangwonense]|uniref:ShlB/FhaC/HecB family hemolysin secretion/activation protein n=1 Tax=Uliginosibacterium gangwonense TaxID=392736 RepID=UPI0003A5EEF7|nr:ShlB/FhaC/HecB family hemolysin secretion/activation protein [Uliginosibacterium gangwonense]
MFSAVISSKLPAPLARISMLSALSFLAPWALAANPVTPNYGISDAVKDANAPIPPAKATPADTPNIHQEMDKPMEIAEGEKIHIHVFRIEDAEFIDAKDWEPLLAPYRDRDLSMRDINEAARLITALCRNRGYMVARAYVPKQNAQSGELLIKVVVGRYGELHLKNSSPVRDFLILGAFEHARDTTGIIQRSALERAMLLVNDMPGTRMPDVNIAPGSTPESSDFTIDAKPRNRISGYVVADDYGSRFTGKNRLSTALDIQSPLGFADRLSLSAMSSKAKGLQNGRGAYSFPLSLNGWRGEIAASRTTYKLGGEYADLQATGTAHTVEATFSYPILRSRDSSLYLALNLANKHLKDEIAAVSTTTAKRAKVASLSLEQDSYGKLGSIVSHTNVMISITYGRLGFDDAAQKSANAAGANTVGDYSKFNLSLTGNLTFNAQWSLSSWLRGQHSLGKNLDGSEQLSITGASGIKSFSEGVSGDNGFLLGAEIKYALPALLGFENSSGIFFNYGNVRAAHSGYTTTGDSSIGEAGLSYSVSNSHVFARMQISQPMGNHRKNDHHNKALAQIGVLF